ncbi:hypothetical protein BDV18DRAFT_143161 [Aspergillus unguis]
MLRPWIQFPAKKRGSPSQTCAPIPCRCTFRSPAKSTVVLKAHVHLPRRSTPEPRKEQGSP